ncbi:putative RNA polymerase II transcription factor SIII subunit A [Xylariales sp. AK1849]|nr:putative RNA polymerase II transcription factor SIII subunit A [Xylariales sp. AK1849]
MPVKSLIDICTAVCLKNLRDILDVGNLPYKSVRGILLRIDSAVQLRAIEEASPHIEQDDAECWIRLIERQFPVLHTQNNFQPANPASWHKIYARYSRLDAEQKAAAEEKLKNAFAGIKQKKEAKIQGVELFARSNLPKPPRDMKGLGKAKSTNGRRGGSNDTGELRFTAGSRTKTTSGASVMRKVKREAAEVHARNKIATPTGALLVRKSQIRQAPQGMLHEARVKQQPALKIRPPVSMTSRDDEYQDPAMEEREARLRKLKFHAKDANIIEDSDLDEEDGEDGVFGGGGLLDEDDLEDMFDDESAVKSSAPPRKPAALPGKQRGLLSNSHRPSAVVQRVSASSSAPLRQESSPKPKAAPAVAHTSSSSPPLRPSSPPNPPTSGPSGSPAPKPKMAIKRKAVDVFMKPKPKVQRR